MSVNDYSLDRGLPASPEIERNILGAMLMDSDLCDEVFAVLKPEHFFLSAHRRIYNRILDLAETSKPIEIVTVTEQLMKHKELEAVGGAGYVASLTDGVPRRKSLIHYIDIVQDKAKLRDMIHTANSIVAQCFDQAIAADEVISDAEASILSVAAEGDGEAVPVGAVTNTVEWKLVQGRSASLERDALEMTWGVSGLDSFTRGMFGGEMTVLSGESGGGKTSIAMQITLANAREGTPCVWFSLEMPKEKLVQRLYPQMGDIITANMMRDPRLLNDEVHIPEIQQLSAELQTLPIYIDDTSSLPINKLIARMRMLRRKYGRDEQGNPVRMLVVVDYLQLVLAMQSKTEAEGIKAIVFALRDVVKADPLLHLLLLSQYSKADGFAKKKKRSRGDLYGSSAIHHAAQNVLLITVEEAEKKEKDELLECEFNFDKQRDGRKGKVSCFFDRAHLRCCYAQPPLR